jgi:glycosyltransferase involved in cell wall biosynthesis
MTATLSVVILTLNEESNIVDCIASVKGADQVLVLDAGSTDRTQELARGAGAVVVVRPMTDFAEQRNFANQQVTSDWVLHLDADERATPGLMQEIGRVSSAPSATAYWVPELTYIFGAPLYHGGWYPQYHVRFQRRGHGTWGRSVHEGFSVDGPIGHMKEHIVHYAHPSVSEFIAKLNRYTDLEAKQARGSTLGLALRAVLEPGPYFLYKYLVQQGFRDGTRGLTIALLMAFYRCVTYVKALELRFRR